MLRREVVRRRSPPACLYGITWEEKFVRLWISQLSQIRNSCRIPVASSHSCCTLSHSPPSVFETEDASHRRWYGFSPSLSPEQSLKSTTRSIPLLCRNSLRKCGSSNPASEGPICMSGRVGPRVQMLKNLMDPKIVCCGALWGRIASEEKDHSFMTVFLSCACLSVTGAYKLRDTLAMAADLSRSSSKP